jgi:hypothetical protein
MDEHGITINTTPNMQPQGLRDQLKHQASCNCGWEGPQRFDENLARQDAQTHLA